MNILLLGLITGVAFGYILYRSGVSQCDCIFDALNLLNLKAVKLMMTAVAVGALIVYPLAAAGLVEIGGKTLYVGGVALGGLIFGIGFAVAGYCPGTALASLGGGRLDGLTTILGGLAGALAYSLVYEPIKPWLIDTLNFGQHSLPEALGVNPTTAGITSALLLGALVFAVDRWERRRTARQAAPVVRAGDMMESDARARA